MSYFQRAFTPTKSRRLNELVGFLYFTAATLLFLSLASYAPTDDSWNTAASVSGSHPASNLIGVVGANVSDILLQIFGIGIFLIPVFITMWGLRWFRSRKIESPIAKTLGATFLVLFIPALLSLLPWHFRWRGAAPVEGLLGRIIGDALMHYQSLAGATIV
jgi:S-DNA-T family DNA segregation ATPase FtsK/SpoIIIE